MVAATIEVKYLSVPVIICININLICKTDLLIAREKLVLLQEKSFLPHLVIITCAGRI
jgi:hypothetical protein